MFKACMSLAFLGSTNATTSSKKNVTTRSPPHQHLYFDVEDSQLPPKPGKVVHLSIDYQTIGKWEKGRKACYTSSESVNSFLSDIDYHQLVGKNEAFNTLACALASVEKIQQIEAL